jgi:hypothetical protein
MPKKPESSLFLWLAKKVEQEVLYEQSLLRSPQESDEPIEFTGILDLGFPGVGFEVGI